LVFLRKYLDSKEIPNVLKEFLLSERGRRILFNFLMKFIEKVGGNEEEASRENSGEFRLRF